MEKKSKIKNRIFAGFLAFTLMGCKPMLVKGEEQLVQEETQVELIDMFKVDYSSPEYQLYEHKYVSDDGKIEKWYVSYLPEIEGLKRTDEKRQIESAIYEDGEQLEGDYTYLYCNRKNLYVMPFDSEDNNILYNITPYVKTQMVTEISDEALKILHDYGVCRIVDNAIFFKKDMEIIKEQGKAGMALLKPLFIDENGLHVEIIGIPTTVTEYNHETMNGLLVLPELNSINDNYFKATEEQKQFVIKKK